MPRAIKMTLKNQPIIAEANGGLTPYSDEVVATFTDPPYFIVQEEDLPVLVVPQRSFKRRFKFVESENPDQFTEVIKKK